MNKKTDVIASIKSLLDFLGLTKEVITRIATESGFLQRNSGKYEIWEIVYVMMLKLVNGTASYNDIAAAMDVHFGNSVSRQAIFERLNADAAPNFCKALLNACMMAKLVLPPRSVLMRFSRIMIQDSTMAKLPTYLIEFFSGVRNSAGATCNTRIQLILDLLSSCLLHFSIDSYSRNDLLAAWDMEVQAGDLVLRDRGYLSTDIILAMEAKGAFYIYRYKHSYTYYRPDNGKEIKLVKILRNGSRNTIDRIMQMGKGGPSIRFVGIRLPQEVANERRRKLHRDTKGHKPSKELLELCDWAIYLTNLPASEFSFEDIRLLYGLRWRIECIFKTWKSHFKFEKLHQVSRRQVLITFYIRLIMICATHHGLWIPLAEHVARNSDRMMSLLKFTRYLSSNWQEIGKLVKQLIAGKIAMAPLIRYCAYDRRKRQNFEEVFYIIRQRYPKVSQNA